MTDVQTSVDVEVPVRTAYNQWTQFESFPEFMSGVKSVKQIGDTLTHWEISVAGVTREFDAEITEQTPDQRIAWKSTDGASHAGVVTFHRLDDSKTRVMLQMDTEPEGLVEKAADAVGADNALIKLDLASFKKFIESQGEPTGAYRGHVENN